MPTTSLAATTATSSSADTRELNRRMSHFEGQSKVWLFGYGSLIWKADFAWHQRRPAVIHDLSRRFWQGSHDHRGTLEAPGRVATLVDEPGAECLGMAYLIDREILAPLDLREKNGYLRRVTTMHFVDKAAKADNATDRAEGLVYIATQENTAWLGEAPLTGMVEQISQAHGPSGANAEYLHNLADALRELGGHDEHVFTLADTLRERMPGSNPQR
ncbi:gamma-glutamylcyclotransferase [Halomonas huangheensis]|uniref:glutathione-specific gamma-glutamylcyclotransferase n=1 Tax=Halomonas huangheensis TaxID=1178482 RepID=W1N7N5_9GAMM|nr:gamma-glutamylcyclotransferase [Halomonas huangheensis]ALM53291.1 gamma-glutamyl cyclotransferase [Halomonas huangheensis]ERL51567.1 hypothetical protein BJB45_12995 [Halomonas huangheensis]